MQLDRDHLRSPLGQLRRLATGSRAEVQNPLSGLCAHRKPGELGATALGPHESLLEPLGFDPVDDAGLAGADHADGGFRRLVLGAQELERLVAAPLPPPGLRDPVGIRVLQRSLLRRVLGERGEQRADLFGDPAEDGVDEARRPARARGADELHSLVHARPRRHPVEVRKLVCAQSQRRPDRDVERRHRASADLLERVIERPHALDRAVGDPLRESAVARIETGRLARERAVGVGTFVENAHEAPMRDAAGRTRAHGVPLAVRGKPPARRTVQTVRTSAGGAASCRPAVRG